MTDKYKVYLAARRSMLGSVEVHSMLHHGQTNLVISIQIEIDFTK
jgi:hypothetical protein